MSIIIKTIMEKVNEVSDPVNFKDIDKKYIPQMKNNFLFQIITTTKL